MVPPDSLNANLEISWMLVTGLGAYLTQPHSYLCSNSICENTGFKLNIILPLTVKE